GHDRLPLLLRELLGVAGQLAGVDQQRVLHGVSSFGHSVTPPTNGRLGRGQLPGRPCSLSPRIGLVRRIDEEDFPREEPMSTQIRGRGRPLVADATSSERRRWLVLAVTVVAQFMVVLDVSVVNVALPSIKNDLHFSQESLQWVITAYSILFGGALLLGG